MSWLFYHQVVHQIFKSGDGRTVRLTFYKTLTALKVKKIVACLLYFFLERYAKNRILTKYYFALKTLKVSSWLSNLTESKIGLSKMFIQWSNSQPLTGE